MVFTGRFRDTPNVVGLLYPIKADRLYREAKNEKELYLDISNPYDEREITSFICDCT